MNYECTSDRELIATLVGAEYVSEALSALDTGCLDGLSEGVYQTMVSALEVGRRWGRLNKARHIGRPEDVYDVVRHYADRDREHVIVIALNGAHEVMFTEVVSIGTLTQSLVHPREVFARALKERAVGIILVHNHPSGSLKISPEDAGVTRRIREAGELLGVKLLDHLIISQEGFVSLKAQGFIE